MIYYTGSKKFAPRVRRVSVPRRGFKLRIVFFADVHADERLNGAALARIADIAAAEQPDIVLLGGDYGESVRRTREFFECMRIVRPQLGVFAVPGNNDLIHFGMDYEALDAAADENGINLLVNRQAAVMKDGVRIVIGGTDDACVGEADTTGFFTDAGPDDFRILLTHRPKTSLVTGLDAPCDLILCGHTHGGQGSLFGITPYSLFFEYGDGLIASRGEKEVNGARLMITDGIGTSRIPLRINVPPEIMAIDVG